MCWRKTEVSDGVHQLQFVLRLVGDKRWWEQYTLWPHDVSVGALQSWLGGRISLLCSLRCCEESGTLKWPETWSFPTAQQHATNLLPPRSSVNPLTPGRSTHADTAALKSAHTLFFSNTLFNKFAPVQQVIKGKYPPSDTLILRDIIKIWCSTHSKHYSGMKCYQGLFLVSPPSHNLAGRLLLLLVFHAFPRVAFDNHVRTSMNNVSFTRLYDTVISSKIQEYAFFSESQQWLCQASPRTTTLYV